MLFFRERLVKSIEPQHVGWSALRVWATFVAGATVGAHYKFEVEGADGVRRLRADPMARRTEAPPSNASIVDESQYEWGDDDWMAARARSDPVRNPLRIYEAHLGSWRVGLG
jgi:1,4-alpha-glucan branching enzyme